MTTNVPARSTGTQRRVHAQPPRTDHLRGRRPPRDGAAAHAGAATRGAGHAHRYQHHLVDLLGTRSRRAGVASGARRVGDDPAAQRRRTHPRLRSGRRGISALRGSRPGADGVRHHHALDPNPAYVSAGDFEVLAWNAAAALLLPSLVVGWDGERPNVARWLFCDPDAREVLPEWEFVAQDVLARLRAAAGRHPDDPRYTELVEELQAASVDAQSWWPRHDVRASTVGRKRVRHPERGVLDLAHAAFAVADHPEQTLVVYLDEGAAA